MCALSIYLRQRDGGEVCGHQRICLQELDLLHVGPGEITPRPSGLGINAFTHWANLLAPIMYILKGDTK